MIIDNAELKYSLLTFHFQINHRRSWHGITTKPFNLSVVIFNKKYFIISSLFPEFNLLVSICIQSDVNTNLHVSTLYNSNYQSYIVLRQVT